MSPYIFIMEHFFTTYIRTKMVFQSRLNDLKDYSSVKIYLYELKKLGVDSGPLLFSLKQDGQISFDSDGRFKVLRDGPINPKLLERTKRRDRVVAPLTDLHIYMREQLMHVTIDSSHLPVYFKAFLQYRHRQLASFFTVDSFSGRVHTPVVNLKGDLRRSLKLKGRTIVSLDVKQMQPTILAKILLDTVGVNSFSASIFQGHDVYILLQQKAGLPSRADAKKLLFQLIFGKPMKDIGNIFKGDCHWVDWINSYKSTDEPRNPHRQDRHTNLAWLLQYSEVQVMTDIWRVLMDRSVSFLTIHDDVLCRDLDKDIVYGVMDAQLKKHFPKYSIVIDHS